MTSQGIWFGSFLVCGLLLQVFNGQSAKYSKLKWNQNRYKQQAKDEPRLGAFDRVNTTDIPEEFEPVTNSSGIIVKKPMPGQETFLNTETGNLSRLIKQRVTKVQQTGSRVRPLSNIIIRTPALAIKGKGWSGQVQLYSFVRRNKDNDLTKTRNGRKRDEIREHVVTDGENVDKTQMPAEEAQNQTATQTQLWILDRINTTESPEEVEQITKNQSQALSTTESELGILDRINITRAPEKFEPITNTQSQDRTATESQLGSFDRINTTDVPEEFEPVTNDKGVIINKPVQGQEMFNDILTRAPEQINITSDKSNHMSLSQTRMTAKPSHEAFDKANVTDALEPVTNTARGITNQSVSVPEMLNNTLESGNGNTSRLIKQEVRQVQKKESTVKPHKISVRIFNAFKRKDRKDQEQLYSVIENNQRNDSTRNNRKRGESKRKDKESDKKFKKN